MIPASTQEANRAASVEASAAAREVAAEQAEGP
jgi:hypothetical protein